MSKAMEERINREKDKERIDCSYEYIKNLMEDMKMTAERAISILKVSDEDKASILWNLINLGYADTYFTSDEREVVDFLREYWEMSDSLYQEMIDVAETCLALEKHKKWAEELPESDFKLEKIKRIKKDLKFTQETIKTTISEIAF